jgi:hypothetical protein
MQKSMLNTLTGQKFTILFPKTPAQHLRDRDAEKGRAAFVAGFYKAKQVYDCELGQCATDLDEMASDYAERVKAGE